MDAATSAAEGAAELDNSWSNGGAVEGASSAGFERNASKSPIAVCLFATAIRFVPNPNSGEKLATPPNARSAGLDREKTNAVFPSFFPPIRSSRS